MAQKKSPQRIGLALSGGGARGLGHVPVLEAFDELGLRPCVIAGTSIGAIIGAGYAAGLSGGDIRDYAVELFRNRSEVLSRLWSLRPKRVSDLFAGGGLTIGQFDAERILDAFLPQALPRDFAALTIPMKIVATDFYGWEEKLFTSGPLFPVLAASAAIPVLFRPVMIGGCVMVDGGISNPLPFDHVADECDIVVAVDVIGGPDRRSQPIRPSRAGVPESTSARREARRQLPGSTEAIFGATQLFMQSITREKMRRSRPPDILIRPPANTYRVLDFLKAATIIKDAEAVKDDLKRELDRLLAPVRS